MGGGLDFPVIELRILAIHDVDHSVEKENEIHACIFQKHFKSVTLQLRQRRRLRRPKKTLRFPRRGERNLGNGRSTTTSVTDAAAPRETLQV